MPELFCRHGAITYYSLTEDLSGPCPKPPRRLPDDAKYSVCTAMSSSTLSNCGLHSVKVTHNFEVRKISTRATPLCLIARPTFPRIILERRIEVSVSKSQSNAFDTITVTRPLSASGPLWEVPKPMDGISSAAASLRRASPSSESQGV